jgi:hypothetical protein
MDKKSSYSFRTDHLSLCTDTHFHRWRGGGMDIELCDGHGDSVGGRGGDGDDDIMPDDEDAPQQESDTPPPP